jgi:hypothetical protein
VAIQEFMEDCIPCFVPVRMRHDIGYFFDIYDAEERISLVDAYFGNELDLRKLVAIEEPFALVSTTPADTS